MIKLMVIAFAICGGMSRFFFNVTDRYNSPDDEEGVELPNVAAARERAVQGARSLLCDDIMRGILDLKGSSASSTKRVRS